jgi:hypothetical protein
LSMLAKRLEGLTVAEAVPLLAEPLPYCHSRCLVIVRASFFAPLKDR